MSRGEISYTRRYTDLPTHCIPLTIRFPRATGCSAHCPPTHSTRSAGMPAHGRCRR